MTWATIVEAVVWATIVEAATVSLPWNESKLELESLFVSVSVSMPVSFLTVSVSFITIMLAVSF